MTDSRVYFAAVYIPLAATITGVKWFQVTQGAYTADNNNKVGLYTYSGGTLTLAASSTTDGNLWKATSGAVASKAFSGTYPAAAGTYFVALLWNNSASSTTPTLGSTANNLTTGANILDFTNSAGIHAFLGAQTDLPGSQAFSGLTTTSQQIYWVAVY